MAYSLLGAHVSYTASGIPELIARWKPPLVVLLDHSSVWLDVKKETPDTLFVGRLVLESEYDFNDGYLDVRKAAREHCAKVMPWAERMQGAYDYWQGVNEPVLDSPEAMKRYGEFDAERTRILGEQGFRVVVGSFSVGNPKLPYWTYFLPALEAARQYQGALALHEYAWPTLDTEWKWYLLRHRKVYEGEKEHNWGGFPKQLRDLPLLITECGLDGLIERGHPPRGWRALYGHKQPHYLEQLAWYDAALKGDPYVAGAAIFCCGTGHSSWSSYDIWPELAQELAAKANPLYRLKKGGGSQPSQPARPNQPSQPVAPEVRDWRMQVEYRAGARIIAGSLPRAGVPIVVRDLWGNESRVVSGSKPEYGEGGFEVLAPNVGTYIVSFDGGGFPVHTQDGVTLVTFYQADTEPGEVPSQPTQPPAAEPLPGAEPPPPATQPEMPSPAEPLPDDAFLDQLLERLERVLETLQQRL